MSCLETELEKTYEIKTQKLGWADGYKAEGKVLNKVIRRTEEGWEMEADPCHAEFVIEQLGFKHDRGIGTPGLSVADEDDNDDDVPLAGSDITSSRGVSAGATTSVVIGPIIPLLYKNDAEK